MRTLRFFIDLQDHLLAGLRTVGHNPDLGGQYTTDVIFDDYQSVGDVRFANKVTINIAEGALTIVTNYDSTEINVELDDQQFDKPKQ